MVLIINPIYKSSSGADDHIELKNKNNKEWENGIN